MNTDIFANMNEFDLSSINNLKGSNINENINNDIISSDLLLMNSNSQKLINFQLINSYQQLPQTSQSLETNFDVANSVSTTLASQQEISSSSETIDNKQLEKLIQNNNSKLIAVSEVKTENAINTVNDSNLYLGNNNIPYVSNLNEINKNINYIPNIDGLYLYNNINNIDTLNNITLGGFTDPVSSYDSLLNNKIIYNPSKFISLNSNNYYTTTIPSTSSISPVDQSNIPNPLFINSDPKVSLINPISHTTEILTVPPAINTVNKETKYIYKRRKRQTIDKTTGNIIQKKMKKKSKISQDLIHEKPGGLVSVNVLQHETGPVSTAGFRGRKLRGKYSKGYDKNDFMQRNIIDYQIPNQSQNYSNINSSTITTPINYTKVRKEEDPLNSSYLQLQLNNQVQTPDFFSSFITTSPNMINNFSTLNTKNRINTINSYYPINEPKAVPNSQYIINKNDIKKEDKISNLNSINENTIFEALTPTAFVSSSSSSLSSSPKSSTITSSSINNINNNFTTIKTSNIPNKTISYVNSKTEQVKFNNIYPPHT
ncbi:hypothetical protein BCR32DRAFT_296081 [Anaeromyces robustus]|uniref:Uncharacterized protein n=1 Tax=Anaeromyces robustus TaxID=1754192 RepID=A0A1Y1WT27_9FUNG|nr:hypothetical protein BCR32DRAFT_296081 [Anaeromyces robustus]|eukprot:ORX76683.1 hypothetical protein BCR32DRAFT_296081 [Anaeromyces robustus]